MAHVLRKAPLSNKSYRFCYRFGHSTCLEFWRFHVASLDVSVCSGAACTSKYSLSSLSLYKRSLSSLSEPQFVQLQLESLSLHEAIAVAIAVASSVGAVAAVAVNRR